MVTLFSGLEEDEWFSKDEYVNALRQLELKINEKQRLMLKAQAEAHEQSMFASDLALVVGYSSHHPVNKQYGDIGKRLADVLEFPPQRPDGSYEWWKMLSTGKNSPNGFVWTMHPGLVEALYELGWANLPDANNVYADMKQAEAELAEDSSTDRQAVVMSRIGQGLFRQQLLKYWTRCAVTGISITQILRASHIKPWRKSTNQERLDPFNGLLLVGTLDLLFDAGLISFTDSGQMLISTRLSPDDRVTLNVHEHLHLHMIEDAHQPYLAFHRQHVYCDQ